MSAGVSSAAGAGQASGGPTIIDGNAIAAKIRDDLKEKVAALSAKHGRVRTP
jgi:hypothetical protein